MTEIQLDEKDRGSDTVVGAVCVHAADFYEYEEDQGEEKEEGGPGQGLMLVGISSSGGRTSTLPC